MNKAEKKVYRMGTLSDLYNYLESRLENLEIYEMKRYQETLIDNPEDEYYTKQLLEAQEKIEIIEAVQNEILKIM